jgi:hypothetical protein
MTRAQHMPSPQPSARRRADTTAAVRPRGSGASTRPTLALQPSGPRTSTTSLVHAAVCRRCLRRSATRQPCLPLRRTSLRTTPTLQRPPRPPPLLTGSIPFLRMAAILISIRCGSRPHRMARCCRTAAMHPSCTRPSPWRPRWTTRTHTPSLAASGKSGKNRARASAEASAPAATRMTGAMMIWRMAKMELLMGRAQTGGPRCSGGKAW